MALALQQKPQYRVQSDMVSSQSFEQARNHAYVAIRLDSLTVCHVHEARLRVLPVCGGSTQHNKRNPAG